MVGVSGCVSCAGSHRLAWLITLEDHEQVSDLGAPLLVHTWLGPLYRHGAQELIGSIDLDSAVRPPRHNGDHGAEILLEVGTVGAGPQLAAHVDACAVRIRHALDRLPEHRAYAVSHAPADWVRYVAAQPGPPLVHRLFLDGIEVSSLLQVLLAFDFGDLDTLVARLDQQGRGEQVFLRP